MERKREIREVIRSAKIRMKKKEQEATYEVE